MLAERTLDLPRALRGLLTLLVALAIAVPGVALTFPGTAHAVTGDAIVAAAAREAGKPYVWGAEGPNSFDCSGLVKYVFAQFGISLPHYTGDQYAVSQHLAQGQEAPGDLIFFYNSAEIYHVGIAAGNGRMWAAPKTGDVVKNQPIYQSKYLVGRIPGVVNGSTAILAHYYEMGGPNGIMGAIKSAEYAVPGGRAQNFGGGVMYWSPATGAHAVGGAILAKYATLGATGGFLGFPTSDEVGVPGGRANTFQGANLYWSVATGAHAVGGAILGRYAALGGSGGPLGFPTTDEVAEPGGRSNTFTGGKVYWSAPTGAHVVWGAILDKYLALGGPAVLNFPTSDELAAGAGRFNTFLGGNVYWSPSTGAHEVHGEILRRYLTVNGPTGTLGFPTTDEQPAPGGRQGKFQHGTISWTAATNTTKVSSS